MTSSLGAPSLGSVPVLVGELTLLRPFTVDDADAMAEILRDPEVNRLTGSVRTSAEAEAAAPDLDRLREWYGSRSDQTDRLDLAVVDRETGTLVGEVVLNDWDPDNASCNFRILLGPDGRGRGLGTEATRLLLDHAFAAIGLHRVSLGVLAFNPRAQHVYARAGFVVEGVEREAHLFDGEWVDSVLMAVLDHEWAARR
ncbi:GNAT family N-acetyltransferase [Georgenia faecalis]|uniref:GNAT family N-acetyltransferase n=1 Tax=Georgenia faecalis TaxID=2483799 RepID=A0ABV9D7E8_9MICO|nr:GNAT family protein [Georgenia faecalis]